MEVHAFKGWCPIAVDDEVVLRDGRRGTVDVIRTIQELYGPKSGRQQKVWFEIHLTGLDAWFTVDQVMEQFWSNDFGEPKSRKLG